VAPLTTFDEVESAKVLGTDAQAKVDLVKDADKKAAFQARVDAQKAKVEAADASFLKIDGISAIDNNTVTVKFPEVKVAIENAKVTVKDSNNNVVETKSVLIAEGATEADFDFVTPIKDADKVGVWTVNGKEYSFTAITQLAAIDEAVKAGNEVKLQAALDAAGIKYADEARMAVYLDTLNDPDALTSLDAVQKAITKVDEDGAVVVNKAAAVKAVADATTQAKLLAALQANFQLVNADWIVEYANVANLLDFEATDDVEADFEAIQKAVYNINIAFVGKKVAAANMKLDSKLVSEARALIKWLPVEFDDEPVQEYSIAILDLEDALIAVNQAKTNSALKTALTNLDKLENALLAKADGTILGFEEEFDLATVIDANLTSYRTAIANAELGDKNQRKDIQKLINDANGAANDAALLKALADINKVDSKTTADAVLALLQNKALELDNEVKPAYADAYKKALVEALEDETTFDSADAVDALVASVNGVEDAAALLASVNTASTASQLSKALVALEASQESNDDFTNISSQAKLEVAEIVLATRNAIEAGDGQKAKEFKNAAAALTAATDAITARAEFIATVNGIVTEATDEYPATIAGMKAVLASEDSLIPSFAKLGAADQTDAAEAVLNKLQELQDKEKPEVFKSIADIKTAAGL
ncbi:hypothetical protein, partial [Brevibacillus sp. AY1]|uniref:hypothetical protein n=1 Tax=Brevibacillus sp. AY1 TaxID=2807621 RepID=UPI002455B6EA